ncbi:MAG: DUF3883 domain-containing protein [Oscillospiraceae bacterium]|jgi:hypothetical protein|nr:DUF3883 domain-containing protein [Oscillospiraceae bacterium]
MYLTKTDKTTLAGLYIAKFDKNALNALGFSGMWQAFNVIGYSLGSSPASVKNYRDEFDRLFPGNPRVGWQRPLKTRSKTIFNNFNTLDFGAFTDLIKGFLIPEYEEEKEISSIIKLDANESVAKRLITGKAAEEYFKATYTAIDEFREHKLKDTTGLACGFDFKLSHCSSFYCVEVKGLNQNTGNIIMTEKEYFVANELKGNYCLFIVKNFSQKPNHRYIFNPVNSGMKFKRLERTVVQVNYSMTV